MYVSVLKIKTVRVQASRLHWQAEVTVREVDLRLVRYTRCKIFHKLALKTSFALIFTGCKAFVFLLC